MRAIDIVIGLGWIAFWIGWLSAAVGAKSGRSSWGSFLGFRLVIIVVIVGLGRIPAFRHATTHDPVLGVIGLAVFVAGLAVAVWARVQLGRNWGMPMSEKADPELVTSGPYQWIRNPIYAGLLLAMIGTAIAVSVQWIAVVVPFGAYFIYSAVMEQRYMTARFPDTYPEYRDRTKMLIPFIL